jgi:hypothetical protein
MAYDAEPGGDPRGPRCPKCGDPIRQGQPWTIIHSDLDPDGSRGIGGLRWHSECARPLWDTLSGTLQSLRRFGS